jgi:hypothetical protein
VQKSRGRSVRYIWVKTINPDDSFRVEAKTSLFAIVSMVEGGFMDFIGPLCPFCLILGST